MEAKTLLIVLGVLLLLLGLPMLFVAWKKWDWEQDQWKKHSKDKDAEAPKNLRNMTYAIGGVLTFLGLLLFVWGLMHHVAPQHLHKHLKVN